MSYGLTDFLTNETAGHFKFMKFGIDFLLSFTALKCLQLLTRYIINRCPKRLMVLAVRYEFITS